jgi:hypothetical protein
MRLLLAEVGRDLDVATLPTGAMQHPRMPARNTRQSPHSARHVSWPTRRQARLAGLIALAAAAAAVLSSCGSSGRINPTRSPTVSGLPSRTAAATSATPNQTAGRTTTRPEPSRSAQPTQSETPTQTAAPTQTATQTQTAVQTQTETAVQTQTATQTQTAVQTQTATQTQTAVRTQTATATSSSTPTQSPAAASSDTSSSTPAWVWWLIGAIVLALAITTAILLRRRARRRAWADKFTAAKGEVTWFARDLIPQLSQAPTAEQVAGGWRVEADRVVAVEDRLTALEAAAGDELSRGQAGTLRDAVRASRNQLAGLDTAGDAAAAQNLLRSTAAHLEAALASVDPVVATQTAPGDAPPR